MKKILIVNGPNLNLLGQREDNIYGSDTLKQIELACIEKCEEMKLELDFYQSNNEGEIIDKMHGVHNKYDGIIINPAAFTHTSIAILDCLRSITKPKIEIHLSNIYSREDFRRKSLIAPACDCSVCPPRGSLAIRYRGKDPD